MFVEVKNNGRVSMSIQQDYDTDDVKYCITDGPEPDERSKCNVFIDNCSFSHINEKKYPVFFQNDTGLIIELDPLIPGERPLGLFINRYKDFEGFSIYEECPWLKIETIPFDTEFFEVGHPYIIRLSRGKNAEFRYAILVSMTVEKMIFVYQEENKNVDEEDRNQINNLICTHEVTAESYEKMRKDYWFQALSQSDRWSDKDD